MGKIKILFIPLMLFFSILIVYGLYSGFSHTAEITKANLESETTSSVLTTIKTTSSTIRHTTVESTTTTTSSTSTTSTVQPGDPECEELGCPYGTNFVGSKNSDMYHYCSCSYAKSINPENLICFNNTEEAEEKGYTQSSCQPSTTTTSSTSTSTTVSTASPTTSSTGSTTTTTTTELTTTTITTTNECVSLGCPEGTQFVGSKNSDKYHYCNCSSAITIKPENLKCFNSKEEAQGEGYIPCGKCKPPTWFVWN